MTNKNILSIIVVGLACVALGSTPIMALAAAPIINTISPSFAMAGGAGFTLTVNGSNFDSTSQVRFNGLPRTTTYVSSTQLTATIFASDLALAENQVVTVVTPGSNGGTSSAVIFTISGTTPGLPNTGFGPAANAALPLTLALGALLVAGLTVRKFRIGTK